MQIILRPKFQKKYKKLHANQLIDLDAAVQTVASNPSIGTQKTGYLRWLCVYKFKMVGQQTLLGYSVTSNGDIILTLIDFGSHENFYRDLKRP